MVPTSAAIFSRLSDANMASWSSPATGRVASATSSNHLAVRTAVTSAADEWAAGVVSSNPRVRSENVSSTFVSYQMNSDPIWTTEGASGKSAPSSVPNVNDVSDVPSSRSADRLPTAPLLLTVL